MISGLEKKITQLEKDKKDLKAKFDSANIVEIEHKALIDKLNQNYMEIKENSQIEISKLRRRLDDMIYEHNSQTLQATSTTTNNKFDELKKQEKKTVPTNKNKNTEVKGKIKENQTNPFSALINNDSDDEEDEGKITEKVKQVPAKKEIVNVQVNNKTNTTNQVAKNIIDKKSLEQEILKKIKQNQVNYDEENDNQYQYDENEDYHEDDYYYEDFYTTKKDMKAFSKFR